MNHTMIKIPGKQTPPDHALVKYLLLLLIAVTAALIIRISLHENRFRLEGIKRDLVIPLTLAPLPTDTPTPTPTPIQPVTMHNPHTGWKVVQFNDYKLQISFPYSFEMVYYPKDTTGNIDGNRKSSFAYLDLINAKDKINIALFPDAPGFGMPELETRSIPLVIDGKEVIIEGRKVTKIYSFPMGSTPRVDGSYFTIIQNPHRSALLNCHVENTDTSLCDQVVATIKFLK